MDLVGLQSDTIPPSQTARIVNEFPRLDMKRRMSRCFCPIAEIVPGTTYDNFIRDFGNRFVFGYGARFHP